MAGLKAIGWLGSSKKDLGEFPEDVGYNLSEALREDPRGRTLVNLS